MLRPAGRIEEDSLPASELLKLSNHPAAKLSYPLSTDTGTRMFRTFSEFFAVVGNTKLHVSGPVSWCRRARVGFAVGVLREHEVWEGEPLAP